MQVQDFLDKVADHSDLPLLFELNDGRVVQGGYHVTEIKNATYDTIDCGNSVHTWKEVIVQIWVPAEAQETDPHMPTRKFLKIWDAVDGRLNLYRDAEVRIEYGDALQQTVNYQVQGFAVTEDGLVAQMAPPRTMCKPREILVPLQNMTESVMQAVAQGAQRLETVIPLTTLGDSGGACCTPSTSSSNDNSSCCG